MEEVEDAFKGLATCFRPHMSQHGMLKWWAHQDSNLEPKDYESGALPSKINNIGARHCSGTLA